MKQCESCPNRFRAWGRKRFCSVCLLRQWNHANRDSLRLSQRRYRARHRGRILKKKREKYRLHRDERRREAREYMRLQRLIRPEELKAIKARSEKRRRKQINKKARQFYLKHRELYRAKHRIWYLANRENVLARQRAAYHRFSDLLHVGGDEWKEAIAVFDEVRQWLRQQARGAARSPLEASTQAKSSKAA